MAPASSGAEHPSVTRVREALAEAGVAAEVRQIDEATPTATAAAELVGCDVAAIANSLVFMADGAPILVMASGAHRVDTALLAERIGAAKVSRASAEDVRAATGQPIGGVAPVGHPSPLPTYLDPTLAAHETLWAAAGIPASLVPLTYAELKAATGATEVAVN